MPGNYYNDYYSFTWVYNDASWSFTYKNKINILLFVFTRYPGGFSQASAWRVHEIDPTRVSATYHRGLIKTSKVLFFPSEI